MGGGRNWDKDVPRRGGRDLLRAVSEVGAAGAANGGSLADVAEFCARVHEITFRITADPPPDVGDAVALARGDPPVVVNGGGAIGVVEGPAANALNGCLVLDWELEGNIDSVDLAHRTAVATVAGSR